MLIKVLIVDDHSLVTLAVTKLLKNTEDIQVIGCCASGEEAIQFTVQNRADVIVMDIDMPGMGGLESTRILKQMFPGIKILIFGH